MQDLFDQPLAIDPLGDAGQGKIVADAVFEVYAENDLSFTSPLPVYEAVSGAVIEELRSSSIGQLPQFRVDGDPASVILKSGSYAVRVPSALGLAKEAAAAAGLDSATVQAAIAAATTAADAVDAVTEAASTAAAAAGEAATARTDAVSARVAVEAVVATNDGIMKAALDNPTSEFRTALNATIDGAIEEAIEGIAPTPIRMGRGILIGDSTDFGTAGSGSGKWIDYLTAVSGARVRLKRNSAVSGDTTTLMLGRFDADVLAHQPDFVIIGGPTNDHSQGIPEATTRANYAAMVAKARAAGIPVVFRNCWPSDVAGSMAPWNTVALRRAVIQRHNAWLQVYAASEGIPVLDVYAPTVDPATGGLKTAYAGDGVHPSGSAYLAAAQAIVAAGLPTLFASRPPLVKASKDSAFMAVGSADGLYLVDSDGNGTADGVSSSDTGPTKSIITGDPAILGNWQRAAGTATVASPALDLRTTTVTVGHRYAVITRFKVTTGGLRIRASVWGGAGTLDFGNFSEPCEGIAYQEIVATGAATGVRLIAQSLASAGGAVDFQIAQSGVIDLTALGLA